MKQFILLLTLLSFFSCRPDELIDIDPQNNPELYFPSITSDVWDKTHPDSLAWDSDKLEELKTFHEENGTRAFIILKDGKIVVEEYWGKKIIPLSDFDKDSQWYWASAGKTLTAFTVGLAQQEELLDINLPTSTYMGEGWTSLPAEKEALVTVRNQLTMTTGFEYEAVDINCHDPGCLQYRTDAGEQWFYHNGPYTALQDVVANASNMLFQDFMDEKLGSKIGLNGEWMPQGDNSVYFSTAREAARFGLLMLNKGTWNGDPVMTDDNYYNEMINSSQNLNLSYGFLWWLNGKSSIIYPTTTNTVNTSFAIAAPDDMYSAAGKNGQFVNVVPSQNLVVIRMGEAPDGALVPITFHNEMWEMISALYE